MVEKHIEILEQLTSILDKTPFKATDISIKAKLFDTAFKDDVVYVTPYSTRVTLFDGADEVLLLPLTAISFKQSEEYENVTIVTLTKHPYIESSSVSIPLNSSSITSKFSNVLVEAKRLLEAYEAHYEMYKHNTIQPY